METIAAVFAKKVRLDSVFRQELICYEFVMDSENIGYL